MPLVLPPHDEQVQIVEAIQKETYQLNAASDRARREIDLLREYRTRLVADLVTGKLDVRNVVLPALNDLVRRSSVVVDIRARVRTGLQPETGHMPRFVSAPYLRNGALGNIEDSDIGIIYDESEDLTVIEEAADADD